MSLEEINDQLSVPKAIDKCVIAGSVDTVRDRLIDMADNIGPFGTLVSVGHDWEDDGTRWLNSMTKLAKDVAPALSQHLSASSS